MFLKTPPLVYPPQSPAIPRCPLQSTAIPAIPAIHRQTHFKHAPCPSPRPSLYPTPSLHSPPPSFTILSRPSLPPTPSLPVSLFPLPRNPRHTIPTDPGGDPKPNPEDILERIRAHYHGKRDEEVEREAFHHHSISDRFPRLFPPIGAPPTHDGEGL